MKREYPAVYMMANRRNGTIYTGVTNNLFRRVSEHKFGIIEGFTKNYGCTQLVWYESYDYMIAAIAREKYIKKRLTRKMKLAFIEEFNPNWDDLSDKFLH
ncbi:MAG: GIY-YIG nuclease family protein [Alphaproteobacteria bacterium]|nr:GIY-YIG nuclease family protein [Alphaproteobacteria bacterium]